MSEIDYGAVNSQINACIDTIKESIGDSNIVHGTHSMIGVYKDIKKNAEQIVEICDNMTKELEDELK